MTLALLLTAVTGAWADSKVTVKELTASEITAWANDENPLTAADLPGFVEATTEQAQSWDGYPTNGTVYLIYGFDNGEMKKITYYSGNAMTPSQNPKTRAGVYSDINRSTPERYFYVTGITAEAPVTVEPGSTANTWTFAMPGSDVVLTPIYAKAAAFATTGTEPDVKTLLPEAAEGVIAGTDASLIAEGTGIVAFAAASTTVKQGTLMYAIGTSATQAPAPTAFSATAPTAKAYDDAATLYVWYYIKGADAPDGQQATEENTFDDTEPACLTVQVLTNKFDITLNPANANTIEAGKATVTVGGTAATVTDGKLEGVKMGSEVKLEANPGYKFRKVEVKKGAGEPVLLTTITAADNSSFKSGSQTFGDVATVTLTGDYLTNDGSHGGWYCLGSNLTATISVAAANGANITSVKFYTAGGGSAEDKEAPFEVTTTTVTSSNITTYLNGNSIGSYGVSKIEVYGTK